jgi:hypothetical protein
MERTSVKCGKVCPTGKKCSRKTGGGFCYQHGGSAGSSSARTTTPKKASPKKSPRSIELSIPWLDALPMPALQQAMLNMDYHTLNATCRTNKRAASICREPNFREMYMKRGKGILFFGELKQKKQDKNRSEKQNILTYVDDAKNEVDVVYDIVDWETNKIDITRIIYTKKGERIKIILEKGTKGYIMFIGEYRGGKDISIKTDVDKFLESIGKTRWEPRSVSDEGRRCSAKATTEFYHIIKKATDNFSYYGRVL